MGYFVPNHFIFSVKCNLKFITQSYEYILSLSIIFAHTVLNRLVQFNVIRRYVKTNSIYTTHRLNALAAPPGIRV